MDKKEMYGALARKGIIVIDGDTEPDLANQVSDSLTIARASGHEELQIQITSNGGRGARRLLSSELAIVAGVYRVRYRDFHRLEPDSRRFHRIARHAGVVVPVVRNPRR